mmetsp:Transcript_21537/g.67294  ORF Transcript_21537/g.67294 Transcript_21537/m.67294 type:complete len:273 (-) Transcript_21537:146-964(-)
MIAHAQERAALTGLQRLTLGEPLHGEGAELGHGRRRRVGRRLGGPGSVHGHGGAQARVCGHRPIVLRFSGSSGARLAAQGRAHRACAAVEELEAHAKDGHGQREAVHELEGAYRPLRPRSVGRGRVKDEILKAIRRLETAVRHPRLPRPGGAARARPCRVGSQPHGAAEVALHRAPKPRVADVHRLTRREYRAALHVREHVRTLAPISRGRGFGKAVDDLDGYDTLVDDVQRHAHVLVRTADRAKVDDGRDAPQAATHHLHVHGDDGLAHRL